MELNKPKLVNSKNKQIDDYSLMSSAIIFNNISNSNIPTCGNHEIATNSANAKIGYSDYNDPVNLNVHGDNKNTSEDRKTEKNTQKKQNIIEIKLEPVSDDYDSELECFNVSPSPSDENVDQDLGNEERINDHGENFIRNNQELEREDSEEFAPKITSVFSLVDEQKQSASSAVTTSDSKNSKHASARKRGSNKSTNYPTVFGSKRLKCHHCASRFIYKKSLTRHVLEKHFGNLEAKRSVKFHPTVTCRALSSNSLGFCLTAFKSKEDLQAHQQAEHPNDEIYTCFLCPIPFTFAYHNKSEIGLANVKCPVCHNMFDQEGKPANSHHSTDKTSIPMNQINSSIPVRMADQLYANNESSEIEEEQGHDSRLLSSGSSKNETKKCKKRRLPSSESEHADSIDSGLGEIEKSKQFDCCHCSQSFNTDRDHQFHLTHHHAELEHYCLYCPDCDQYFNDAVQFSYHQIPNMHAVKVTLMELELEEGSRNSQSSEDTGNGSVGPMNTPPCNTKSTTPEIVGAREVGTSDRKELLKTSKTSSTSSKNSEAKPRQWKVVKTSSKSGLKIRLNYL